MKEPVIENKCKNDVIFDRGLAAVKSGSKTALNIIDYVKGQKIIYMESQNHTINNLHYYGYISFNLNLFYGF